MSPAARAWDARAGALLPCLLAFSLMGAARPADACGLKPIRLLASSSGAKDWSSWKGRRKEISARWAEELLVRDLASGTTCQAWGGVWDEYFVGDDEGVLVVTAYSGSSGWMQFYDTDTCKQFAKIKPVGRIEGDRVVAHPACEEAGYSYCEPGAVHALDEDCRPRHLRGESLALNKRVLGVEIEEFSKIELAGTPRARVIDLTYRRDGNYPGGKVDLSRIGLACSKDAYRAGADFVVSCIGGPEAGALDQGPRLFLGRMGADGVPSLLDRSRVHGTRLMETGHLHMEPDGPDFFTAAFGADAGQGIAIYRAERSKLKYLGTMSVALPGGSGQSALPFLRAAKDGKKVVFSFSEEVQVMSRGAWRAAAKGQIAYILEDDRLVER